MPVNILKMSRNDPFSFDGTLFEGFGLDDVKVDSFPPSIVETKPYTIDEGHLSAYCRFFTLWMSMPPMGGGVHELDLEFEIEFGMSSGGGPRMIMLLDPSLWRTLMLKKDLNLEILRWFLLLHQFEFEVLNKG